jgi:hypothetical protein
MGSGELGFLDWLGGIALGFHERASIAEKYLIIRIR